MGYTGQRLKCRCVHMIYLQYVAVLVCDYVPGLRLCCRSLAVFVGGAMLLAVAVQEVFACTGGFWLCWNVAVLVVSVCVGSPQLC